MSVQHIEHAELCGLCVEAGMCELPTRGAQHMRTVHGSTLSLRKGSPYRPLGPDDHLAPRKDDKPLTREEHKAFFQARPIEGGWAAWKKKFEVPTGDSSEDEDDSIEDDEIDDEEMKAAAARLAVVPVRG